MWREAGRGLSGGYVVAWGFGGAGLRLVQGWPGVGLRVRLFNLILRMECVEDREVLRRVSVAVPSRVRVFNSV